MTTSLNPGLRLTDDALRAAREGLEPDSCLRVSFAGGCGAFSYRVGSARRSYPGDRLGYSQDGVQVWLDRRAADELNGGTIDFDAEEGFVVDHPLVGRSC